MFDLFFFSFWIQELPIKPPKLDIFLIKYNTHFFNLILTKLSVERGENLLT